MKILLWSDLYPPCDGGIERITATLARQLSDRGHQVAVATSHLSPSLPLPDVEPVGNVTVHRFPFRSVLTANDLKAIAETLKGVAALKQTFRPDIVHLHLQAASSFFHLQTLRTHSCPTVVTVHGEFGLCKAGPGTALGQLFDKAAWISAVSQAMLDDTRALAPAITTKSSVIYNALEPPAPSTLSAPPEAGSPLEERAVVFGYGRLVADKGFDLLLTAFHQLLREIPDAKLVIAGDGPERDRLQRAAVELGIAGSVRLTGRLSDEFLRAEMEKATILVIPSRWREGFGLVALEGAFLGLPIIATRVGGLPEVIEHERTGILVAPEDPEALCQAMLQLLRSPAQRQRLAEAARADVERRFSLPLIIDQYESMYRQACLSATQPPATPPLP